MIPLLVTLLIAFLFFFGLFIYYKVDSTHHHKRY